MEANGGVPEFFTNTMAKMRTIPQSPTPREPQGAVDIIGFDLGHGETALARLSSSARDEEPQMVEIMAKKSQITALGHKPGVGDLIGEQAIKSIGITELIVGIKPMKRRLQDPDHQRVLERFIRKYLHILEETGQVPEIGGRLFVVGSPSGWTDSERTQYARILKQAGLEPVQVAKESRAAFLHIKDSRSSRLHAERLMENVLIIDMGSSTTDFTAVCHLEDRSLTDFGSDLGASLLDRLIFERTLEYLLKNQPIERARLDALFARFPHFERQALIACREGKEKYFAVPELYTSAEHMVDSSLKFRTVSPPIEFEPRIFQAEMEQILKAPLEELNGKSWKKALEDMLREAKGRMIDSPPSLVILTGGASRMDWALEMCKQIFPEAEAVVRGLEPEFTIAKGLARIGHTDLVFEQFREAVESFLASGILMDIAERQLASLMDCLSYFLADELVSHAVHPALESWRKGDLRRLEDLPSEIENRKNTVIAVIMENQMGKVLDDWLNQTLLPELSMYTDPICHRFGIPRSALNLSNRRIGSELNTIDRLPFSMDAILGNHEWTLVTSIVAGIVVGMVTGGAGIAVFHLPLAGQAISAIVGAVLAAYGMEAAKEVVKRRVLPVFSRRWVLSDDKMSSLLSSQRYRTRDIIKMRMVGDSAWKNRLIRDVSEALKQVLHEQMEKAVMWIR